MDKKKLIVGFLLAFFIIAVVFVFWLGMVDAKAYGMIVAITILTIIGVLLTIRIKNYLDLVDRSKEKVKENFIYCFKRINYLLSQQPGGGELAWEYGKNSTMKVKYIKRENEMVQLFGILAKNRITNLFNLVIYYPKDDNIVHFQSSPSADEIGDIWHNFKLFEEQSNPFNGLFPRINKHGKISSINPNMGGSYYMPPGEPEYSTASDKLRGLGGNINDEE